MAAMKNIIIKIIWQIYDKSGARLIWEKFFPPDENKSKRKPSSLIFWVFGFYIVIYLLHFKDMKVELKELKIKRILFYLS